MNMMMQASTFSGFDRALTHAEEKKFFSTLKGASGWIAERDRHAFGLMRNGGLRVGTVVGLTVGDALDGLAAGTMALRPEICKGQKSYNLEVTRRVQEALKGLLAIRRAQGAGLDREAPLLLGREGSDGSPMTVRSLQLRAKVWAKAASITRPISPHWFRHTLGQKLMRVSTAVNPLVTVASALGHSNVNSSAVYSKPSRDEIRMAMQEASS